MGRQFFFDEKSTVRWSEVKNRNVRHWWFQLKSRNGRIVLVSETYKTKRAMRNIRLKLSFNFGIPVREVV